METNTKSNGYQITQTIIRFPDLRFQTRDAHKLRGFFGNLFKEHSPLLHNHFEDGNLRYAYPLVQYKVVDNIPMLTGFGEGGRLLIELFLKIKKLDIDGIEYAVNAKNIENKIIEFGELSTLLEYQFKTLWMALNQKNFNIYSTLKTGTEKNKFLNNQLQNNILSFYKGIGFYTKNRIMVKGKFNEKTTQFKNKKMLAFEGIFTSNAVIPDYTGIGKAVSRGFGTIVLIK